MRGIERDGAEATRNGVVVTASGMDGDQRDLITCAVEGVEFHGGLWSEFLVAIKRPLPP